MRQYHSCLHSPALDGAPLSVALIRASCKDTAKARKLLLEIIDKDQATLRLGSLCYVYVYLGYIEDREEDREEAIAWYKKAVAVLQERRR